MNMPVRENRSALAVSGAMALLLMAVLAAPIVIKLFVSDESTVRAVASVSGASSASSGDVEHALRAAMDLGAEGNSDGEFLELTADETTARDSDVAKFSLRVQVGEDRLISLSVAYAPAEGIAGTSDACADRVTERFALSCSVFDAAGKKAGVLTTNNTYPIEGGEWLSDGPVDNSETLKALGADERWQIRQAKIAWTDDVIVYMSERVRASTAASAFDPKLFSISVEDMQTSVTSADLTQVVGLLERR